MMRIKKPFSELEKYLSGVDEMPDSEFLESLPAIKKKTLFVGIGSVSLMVLFIVLMVLLWGFMF